MNIRRVGVVGAGTMGNGIAHVLARSGFEVTLCDVEQSFLDRALATIGKNLDREVTKNKITSEQKAATLQRIQPEVERSKLGNCDLVIEAATEKLAVKADIFRELDKLLAPTAVLASNTSSISITRLGALTGRPEKVIGMHFFNPVPVMKLVEVIRGLATSDETFQTISDLALKLEKTPVAVNDAPGFVSNRVLMPLLNEAMFAVLEGVATPEAVDEVFKLGMAHPMGPLALADFIGLDVCLDIMRVMQDGLGDPKYRPCPLLIKMVDAGWLGKNPDAASTGIRNNGSPQGAPGGKMKSADGAVYLLGFVLGILAGLLDVKIGDLLLTALFVAAATMLLGALRPEQPWRWTLEVASLVPIFHLLAYLFFTQKPDRAHVYESFLGFVTGIAGAYGGAFGRKGLHELFR